MTKRVNLIIPFITFFFISILTLAFGFLFAVIYPAMGMDIKTIFAHSGPTFAIAILVTVIVAIIIYRFLKPIDRIINNKDTQRELTEDEKQSILANEKNVKRVLIIMTILGFVIAPFIATVASAFRDGFLRWATVRFLIVSWSLGPAAAFFLLLFFSFRMQKVKLAGDIYEFTPEKRKIGIKAEIIATFVSFSFFIVVILTCQALTRDEEIAGISFVALYTRESTSIKTTTDKTKGYFSDLLDACLTSSDPAVKESALQKIKNWESTAVNNTVYIVSIGVVCFLFLGSCIVLYAFDISSHVKSIRNKLQSIVKLEGDLTTLLVKTSTNEIGDIQVLFNVLIKNINTMLKKIFAVARELIQASKNEKEIVEMLITSNNEIVNTSKAVKACLAQQTEVSDQTAQVVNDVVELINKNMDRITRQSAMIEESSVAIIQMNSSLQSVSGATKTAAELGDKLEQTSKKGIEVTSDMYHSIETISKAGSAITEVISSISAITGQTNLLAMNAAIEAAHAGDFGRGFAVVADEVRKLAEDTALKTHEIDTILGAMSENINSSVTCSENLKMAISEITGDIGKTLHLIHEINLSAQEQRVNSNQNMAIIHELVDTTKTIMENLTQQENMNEQLLSAIKKMESAVEKVGAIGKKQEGYFHGLRIHFDNFLKYFHQTGEKLAVLENMLADVKLIEH